MNRERVVLLSSLLLLFVAMTGVLIWSQVFNSEQFFLAGTQPNFEQPEKLQPRQPPIRANDPIRGSGDPKAVTIVEFADFNCEYCRLTYQEFKKAFATTNIPVRFVWRTFPINLEDPQTLLAASAGYCANQQQKFWDVYDRLFTMINPTPESLSKLATEANLNVPSFNQCMSSDTRLRAIQADLQMAKDYSITGAPTIFIGTQIFNGFVSSGEILQAVTAEYKK
jgi:protein-disulfide isomerase